MCVFGAFLVRVFPHLDWILKGSGCLSVLTPNAGKHGLEKLQIWTIFLKCHALLDHANEAHSNNSEFINVISKGKLKYPLSKLYSIWPNGYALKYFSRSATVGLFSSFPRRFFLDFLDGKFTKRISPVFFRLLVFDYWSFPMTVFNIKHKISRP